MSSNELPVRPLNAVNRGRVVQAVYREPETANYAGNPLIEALPPVLTTEQAMLYDEAQGITDFAVKLYLFAQERAIESGKEEVTAAVIRSAARDKLRLPKPVLDALRRGDQRVLELYEDVYPAMLQAHACSPTDESGDKTASAAAIEQPAVTTPGSSPESCTISDAAGSNQSKRKKQVSPPAVAMGKLPQIAALAAKQNQGVYEALRQSGDLRPVDEYLPVSESPAGRRVEEKVSR